MQIVDDIVNEIVAGKTKKARANGIYRLAQVFSKAEENHRFVSILVQVSAVSLIVSKKRREAMFSSIFEALAGFERNTTVLDLSNHSTKEGECLDLAKNVSEVIANPETPEEKRKTLNQMVDEMVTGGLDNYPPQVVEVFLRAPENQVFYKAFLEEIKGENNA